MSSIFISKNSKNLLNLTLEIIKSTTVCDLMSEEEQDALCYMIEQYFENPSTLIDGRILNNITFALRLYNFLSRLECEDHTELDKCVSFAKKLLDYQIATCTDEKEKVYFKNNNIII